MSTDQPRNPAGAPTGGQFAGVDRPESDVELDAPAPARTRWERSADRPDADTYQWPTNVPRSQAITAYDHEARTCTLGDDLHVTGSWSVRMDRWIDVNQPMLAQLRRCGVRGELEVYSSDGHPDGPTREWHGSVTLPSGALLGISVSAEGLGVSRGSIHEWAPTNRSDAETDPEVFAALEHVVKASALLGLWVDKVRPLVQRGWLASSSVSPRGDASDDWADTTLVVEPKPGKGRTAVYIEPSSGRARAVEEPWQLPEQDQDAVWSRLATRVGVLGGKRTGAGSKLRAATEGAFRGVDGHRDVMWLREGRLPAGQG